MPVIEYKFERVEGGGLRAPLFVEDGGYWQSPIDKTLVGWTPPESEREYYVPDSIVEFTKQQFIDRQLAIHKIYPFTNNDTENPVPLTEEQVIEVMGNWYDDFWR